jgi:hypothetical protein
MNELICLILGHKKKAHLDLIYGSLPREHVICGRCDKTLYFEKCSEEKADSLPLVDCF